MKSNPSYADISAHPISKVEGNGAARLRDAAFALSSAVRDENILAQRLEEHRQKERRCHFALLDEIAALVAAEPAPESYIRNCYISTDESGPAPITGFPDGRINIRLDSYAIVHKSRLKWEDGYLVMRLQPSVFRDASEQPHPGTPDVVREALEFFSRLVGANGPDGRLCARALAALDNPPAEPVLGCALLYGDGSLSKSYWTSPGQAGRQRYLERQESARIVKLVEVPENETAVPGIGIVHEQERFGR